MRSLGLSLCITVIAATTAVGCKQDSFECGTPSSSDPDVITRCDRALEICVCATRSCAKKEPLPPDSEPDAGDMDGGAGPSPCDSGFRYVDVPFANGTWAGECVPSSHVRTDNDFLESGERGQACDPAEVRDSGMMSMMPDGAGTDAGPSDAGTDAGPDADVDAGGDAAVDSGPSDAGADDDDSGAEGES
jgi:hypothetical protein